MDFPNLGHIPVDDRVIAADPSHVLAAIEPDAESRLSASRWLHGF